MLAIHLDMDPGVDDALALLMLLGWPGVDVRAVTTVAGNVPVDRGTRNALALLSLAGCEDIPVYTGAARPWEGSVRHATHVHGESGLGAAQLPDAARGPAGDAWACLASALLASDGDLVLVATGPLTNLALVETENPGLLRRARRVVVMGGAVKRAGNVTPTAEYNVWADPVAADVVFRAGARLLLVPLDATRQALVSAVELAELSDGAGAIGEFCRDAARTPIDTGRREYATDGLFLHDPLTAALAVHPEWGRTRVSRMQVETRGGLTAGQIVVDERELTDPEARRGVDVEWVEAIERQAFLEGFAAGLRGACRQRVPSKPSVCEVEK